MHPLTDRRSADSNDAPRSVSRHLVVAVATSRPSLDLGTEREPADGATHLYVRGDIDLAHMPALRAEFMDAIFSIDTDVVLDCSDMTFIDTLGIRMLAEIERALDCEARRLRITHLSEATAEAIAALGLASMLRIERYVATSEIPATR